MLATGALSLNFFLGLFTSSGTSPVCKLFALQIFYGQQSPQTNWLTTPTNNTLFQVCPEKGNLKA